MFKDAKIGDKVWSFHYGWGVVRSKENNTLEIFFEVGIVRFYWDDGRANSLDKNPDLFWDEIKYKIPQKPIKSVSVSGWAVFTYTDGIFSFKHLQPDAPENIYTNQISFPVKGFLKLEE